VKHRVLTTPSFWEALERELPGEQEPNWHQFASYDLGEIIKTFGAAWDSMPWSDNTDYRTWQGAGRIAFWAVTGQWDREHGEIQLVDIVVQVYPPEMLDEAEDG
jgi:hypothetical protein